MTTAASTCSRRFDNSISVIDARSAREVAHLPMHNPEPASIVKGRRFLYDASFTSSHGDSACASCHIFGDFEQPGLGPRQPDGTLINIPGPSCCRRPPGGCRTTSTPSRGHDHAEPPRHGQPRPNALARDRTGGNDAPSAQPDSGTFDEDAAFKKFNVAFPGLIGRSAELGDADMQAFTDFILQVTYPPNPIRASTTP